MTQVELPSQEDLAAKQEVILERCRGISNALDTASLPNDEITLTALAELLVRTGIAHGVRRKQFLQVLRDMWRMAEAQNRWAAKQIVEPTQPEPTQEEEKANEG